MRDETAEMLIQQGLEEIAGVSTSEQIAFLLVERARLLDELEAEQTRSATMTPATTVTTPALTDDGRLSEDLQRTLEKERSEFEEELMQSRESIKQMKDRLKREHEEEINGLMEENNKLEDDFEEAKAKVRYSGFRGGRWGWGDWWRKITNWRMTIRRPRQRYNVCIVEGVVRGVGDGGKGRGLMEANNKLMDYFEVKS